MTQLMCINKERTLVCVERKCKMKHDELQEKNLKPSEAAFASSASSSSSMLQR